MTNLLKKTKISILLIIVISCRNMKPSINSFPVKFNPGVGSVYKYEITRKRSITQEAGEGKLSSFYIEKIQFSYIIGPNSGQGYKNSIQFNSYSLTHDSTNSESEKIHKDLVSNRQKGLDSVLKDVLFELEINSNGVLKKIFGFQDFEQKRDSLLMSDGMNSQLSANPKNIYTENYFKNLFETTIHFFPDSPIFLNSKWVNNELVDVGPPYLVDVEYKVDKVQEGKVHVTRVSDIKQKLNWIDNFIEMSGTEKGSIQLDSATGMLTQSEKILVLNGHMQLGELPMKMTIENMVSVEGTKVK